MVVVEGAFVAAGKLFTTMNLCLFVGFGFKQIPGCTSDLTLIRSDCAFPPCVFPVLVFDIVLVPCEVVPVAAFSFDNKSLAGSGNPIDFLYPFVSSLR